MPQAALRRQDSGSRERARVKVTKTSAAKSSRDLPKEQADRRAAIAKVVLQLAEDGGYDAIQLRVISKRSGVAMRTIYKYFDSREALISSVMIGWLTQNLRKATAAGKGDDFVDRYLSIMHYSFKVFSIKPKLWETFARMQREGETLNQEMEADNERLRQEFKDVDENFFREFAYLTGCLVYSSLMFCVFGKDSFDEAWSRVERTVRHFARSYP
jgi:AcrR family transcriptional regulator